MTTVIQTIEDVSIPKPETILEAIEIDSRLEYRAIPEKLHTFILENDVEGKTFAFEFHHEGEEYVVKLDDNITKQIKRYQKRDEGAPRIILYVQPESGRRIPIRAVSSLFVQIPLGEVWEKAVAKLLPDLKEDESPFDHIKESVINQAIIAQFPQISTKYKQDGTYDDYEAYEVYPTIVFSANLAERAFQLGFTIGVMTCTNQIFCFFGNSRIVHNKYKIESADFSIEGAIDTLLDNLVTLEETIEKAKTTPLAEWFHPVLYWKACKGQARNLEKTFDEHAKLVVSKGQEKLTLWDGLQAITTVSTHEVANFNSSVELGTRAGQLLLTLGKFEDDDYINALGYYLLNKRKSLGQEAWKKETPFFQRVYVLPLMIKTALILREAIILQEAIFEKVQEAIRPISEEEAIEAEILHDRAILIAEGEAEEAQAQKDFENEQEDEVYSVPEDEDEVVATGPHTGIPKEVSDRINEAREEYGLKPVENDDVKAGLAAIKPSEVAIQALKDTKEKYKPLIDDAAEEAGYVEKPSLKLVGEDGNAFAILARASKALKDAGQHDKVNEFTIEAQAGDYSHLLRTVMKYFDVDEDEEDEADFEDDDE